MAFSMLPMQRRRPGGISGNDTPGPRPRLQGTSTPPGAGIDVRPGLQRPITGIRPGGITGNDTSTPRPRTILPFSPPGGLPFSPPGGAIDTRPGLTIGPRPGGISGSDIWGSLAHALMGGQGLIHSAASPGADYTRVSPGIYRPPVTPPGAGIDVRPGLQPFIPRGGLNLNGDALQPPSQGPIISDGPDSLFPGLQQANPFQIARTAATPTPTPSPTPTPMPSPTPRPPTPYYGQNGNFNTPTGGGGYSHAGSSGLTYGGQQGGGSGLVRPTPTPRPRGVQGGHY